ncbi:MAG: NADH-quinone oxidoreductase subunit NuoF [Myxococcales bacterium]|jgi:NADH-quinone oxidoreductase subunit F|nr:NADH-quinone oxidoreductase subunit NuoF [Myxococcales bacterium]
MGVERYLLPPEGVDWRSLDAYRQVGGYEAAKRALHDLAPEAVIEEVKAAGLRGRGGAGFGTGQKWSFMPKPGGPKPTFIACNGDESEPGTFKDRQIIERNPHLLVEGLVITGHAIGARAAYVYLRGEYVTGFRTLVGAVEEARAAGLLGPRHFGVDREFDVHVMRGAGAYICGEETGMIESAEGKKGQPRKRPPFPAVYGLWGCPTTVNNVETISQIPAIIRRGAAWFKGIGTQTSTGNTLYGISGHVNRPGVYELPLGTPLRELIEVHAGGVRGGRRLKAIIPGGVSMPVLSAEQVDVRMDHESLKQVGSLLGTGGIVVMDETACMVRAALVIARFFRHESCGQCTQCREGTAWLYKILGRIENGEGSLADLEMIDQIGGYMEGQTICALSDAAAWAATGFLRRFRPEFEAHIHGKACPLLESFEA